MPVCSYVYIQVFTGKIEWLPFSQKQQASYSVSETLILSNYYLGAEGILEMPLWQVASNTLEPQEAALSFHVSFQSF